MKIAIEAKFFVSAVVWKKYKTRLNERRSNNDNQGQNTR
jgi:hypothetical protein